MRHNVVQKKVITLPYFQSLIQVQFRRLDRLFYGPTQSENKPNISTDHWIDGNHQLAFWSAIRRHDWCNLIFASILLPKSLVSRERPSNSSTNHSNCVDLEFSDKLRCVPNVWLSLADLSETKGIEEQAVIYRVSLFDFEYNSLNPTPWLEVSEAERITQVQDSLILDHTDSIDFLWGSADSIQPRPNFLKRSTKILLRTPKIIGIVRVVPEIVRFAETTISQTRKISDHLDLSAKSGHFCEIFNHT